jgi:hypothetical protein
MQEPEKQKSFGHEKYLFWKNISVRWLNHWVGGVSLQTLGG